MDSIEDFFEYTKDNVEIHYPNGFLGNVRVLAWSKKSGYYFTDFGFVVKPAIVIGMKINNRGI